MDCVITALMIILAVIAINCFVSCNMKPQRGYKVATVEKYMISPNNNGVEIRYLDAGYSIGDTLVNTHSGLHLEIITDTVR